MTDYDVVIRGGIIYDGSGGDPFPADIAIQGDQISAIEKPGTLTGKQTIDAEGLAVAPGFINILSWASGSLLEDGHSQSDIRQGVTLEVMGEGWSMGPVNDRVRDFWQRYDDEGKNFIQWKTLGGYLQYLEDKGVSTNVASFVGLATLRIYAVGHDDREPGPDEMRLMKDLVAEAMQEGAMGLSTALIYPPMVYAKIEEIIELAKVVSQHNGVYISHLRSEGNAFLEALEEFFTIAKEADVRSEVYHLKASGRSNWHKMSEAIERIEAARAEGLQITADMYTYPAGGTGLAYCLPPWAHDGGYDALLERLRDPETRIKIKAEMNQPTQEWENFFYECTPKNIIVASFQKEEMRHLAGKQISEIARDRDASPDDTLINILLEAESPVGAIYFMMTEENLRQQVTLPWLSFCSDAGSLATNPPFTDNHAHPRAYGSFARVLGKYTREEGLLTLQEAIRKLTSLPADVLKIQKRGRLATGNFADVVVFDPAKVQDHATYEKPHQYSTGMVHVFVNGGHVLKDGEHTGATPGRFVRGPGYQQ